jgi:LPXTG-motif cell wall-anchored protein
VTPTDVTVTYDALVTTDDFKSVDTEKNTVQIEYSHNPNDESDYNYKKDTTQHYTFSLDADVVGGGSSAEGKKTSEVVKIGVKADGSPATETTETSTITNTSSWEGPLEGAVFGLYTDSECNTPYVPKNADGTAGSPMTNITTLSDGRMHIEGLDAGTYYLKEISAPEGYIKDTHAYEIVITAYMTDPFTVTETIGDKEVSYQTEVLDYYTVTIDGDSVATHQFNHGTTDTEIIWTDEGTVELPCQITNTQGTELPSTGGIGTTIFYVMGSILVICAGVVLVTRRRMSA